MAVDPTTTKYLIEARIETEGIVEKPDVVGAIFGQTEGLLGEELDLRDLQKSGRIGRIEVEIQGRKGRSEGIVRIPSSLDQVETAIMAAALETIDRIGPCKATIRVDKVDDVRITKRTKIVDRAKILLSQMVSGSKHAGLDVVEEVRQSVQISEVITWGPDRLPAGPNILDSDSIIIVEGRSDVLALLRAGIKNAVAVEGTNVPKSVQELTKEKTVIAFVDGDRGGDLILKELIQVSETDFIARAPRGREVEEMSSKQITKALRNKMPADQYMEMYGLGGPAKGEDRPDPFAQDDEGPAPTAAPARPAPAAPAPEPRPAVSYPPPPVAVSPPPPSRPARAVPPEVGHYRELLMGIAGTSKAMIVDDKEVVLAEVPVRRLVETLKEGGNSARAVVFDGIITQRILDLAAEIGMKAVVGTKMGTVTKQPASVEVWTRDDFA
ncbi:MAG TPA: DNA primase DnaG [Thermoplasmata archaeon]|nr:DNA primase DnaG [Thermoplasmata archaeon]